MTLFTKRVLIASVIILCAVLALKGSALLISSGTWQATGNLSIARAGASAALLQDGRILITGGSSGTGAGPQTSTDLFNTDGTISAALPMTNARSGHISVTLQNGKVLVAGGITAGGSATSTAEVFDPIANSWTPMGLGMNEARSSATAALLSDGRVLIAGGQNGSTISSTIEIFDPNLGVFTSAGMMSSPRTQHAMTVLQDGRVLIVGGNNGTAPVASTDIFDPVAGAVDAGPALATARFGHSATTLLHGLVVVIGGNNGNAVPAQADATPAEIVDFTAATPAFRTLATNLATPREGHLAVLLPNNNNILIAGGTSAGTTVASAELFTPQESPQGVWTYGFGATGTMTAARSSAAGSANQVNAPSSTMQRNGVVMVAGGNDANGNTLNTTEAYGYPTVQTDQNDYPPGTTVTMNGSGFKPGETITIQLVESPLIDTHGPYTVQADANGNFTDTSFMTDLHDVSVLFYLTATGGTSGFQAQNTFTDGNASSGDGTMTVSPLIVAAGSTGNSFTFTFTSQNGKDFNAGSQATILVPSGWTAPTSGNVTVTNGTCTAASLGTISGSGPWTIPINMTCPGGDNFTVAYGGVTAPTAAGSNTFTTKTKQNGGSLTSISTSPSVTVQAASKLVFGQQPTSTQAGASITPAVTVKVEDANGDLVNTSTASVTITASGGTLSGTTTVNASSGVVTFSNLSINNAGTNYTLTASSSGLTSATSSAFNITQASTTTTITNATSLATATVVGQGYTVQYSVTVNPPGSGTPTGNVTVSDGSASCTATVAAGSCLLTSTSVGTPKTITATYAGDSNFASSTSAGVSHTVNKASTSTTITSNLSTATVVGQTYTVAYTVAVNSPGSGTPTGNVTVSDGSASCTATVAAGTCSLTSTSVGAPKTITATYAGDSNFNGSTSAGVSHTVNQASTTTALTSSANPSVFGQSVTFTAAVTVNSPGAGTIPANETVTFKDGVTTLGTGTTNSSGVATFATSALTVATHSITAVYAGDTNFATSTGAVSQVVNQAATTTALTSSANPSVFGQSVTFTATVTVNSPGAGTIPAGETVTFKDNGSTIGTGTTNTSGVATFATSTLTVATHPITAAYAGDTNFATSTGAVSQVVNKASTTTTITNDLSTATVVGQAYSVSVSVTINAPGAGTIPNSDTVTVSDGAASCTVTLSSATGSCSLTSTTAGNKTITATYNGDANFNTSTSAGVAHTVNKANTTTTITSNTPNPSTVGSAVTINYSVTVNSPGAGTPTGNVTVSDGLGDTCTGTVAAGTCSITFATAGTKTLTATYVGDTNFNTSASTGTSQTVNPKLAFTSTAFAILTGTCSSTVSVQIQNANGSAATLATATVLNLSSNSGTGKFFSDAACTMQITTATIAAGSSTASLFYDDTTISSPVITVASTGLTSVTQAETITGLRFGSAAFSVPVNTCSTAISVQSANASSGNPTSLTQATTINLSSSPNSGKFYSDAACTNQITSTTISPIIDNGHDSPSFFYKNTSAGSATLTASAGTASAQQTESVVTPPGISKAFGAAMIPVNGTTSLSFTITNPAANTVGLTGLAFTDALPAGLVVATTNGLTSTCGGTTTATAGSGTVSLANGTVAASGSCAISVNVTGTTSGVKNNSVTVSSANGGTGNTSTASITVASPPTISKTFGASSITLNTSTSLTFTITNSNTTGLTGVAFSDNLPAGLAVATPNGLSSTCGGTTTAVAGSGSASLSGGTVAASSSCSISLNVTGTALGAQNNTTGTITSNESGPGTTSNTATLTVTGTPPSITSAASTTFTAGVAGSFTVMTSGTPTPSLSDGGATLPGSVTFTDNHNGTATLAGTATVAGSYPFTITAQNGVGTATQAFTLIVNAGAAASISVASGSGQTATVNTAFTNQLVALVQDIYGNAVPSVTVTFAASGSGPSGTFASDANTAMTNAGGMATSATFTANNTAGSYTVTASAPSVTNMASFSLTNTAGSFTQLQLLVPGESAAPGTTTGKTGTPNTEYVNGAFNVTVNAVDQFFNLVNTVGDTVQISSNDAKAKLPSNAALVAGTGTFSVTLETVSYNPATTTITASDFTDGSKTASTSPAITVIIVYTATISPTMAGTGNPTTYTLTVNNAPAPNANNLASVEIAVPSADQGTITGVSVTATPAGGPNANWSYDPSLLPGTLRFVENTANDAVTPGGTITITFTGTSNATVSTSPVYEVWNTTAFSDAASQNALPLASPEPTVSIGQAPAITSASSTSAFTYGAPNTTFTVTATGTPTPSLSESGSFPSWATFKDNGNGTATISGTPSAAGTSTFTITAHNGFGPDATQTFTLIVQKADQTITVTMPAPAMAVYNTNFTVAATASSGDPVTFSSSGVCTNAGATFTMTSGTGTCTVKFDQAGDSNYNAAPEITESVTAQKAPQTITVTTPAPAMAYFASQFTVAATASSGNTVSFYSSGVCTNSGATFTMTSGTGICTVKFDQAGDTNYNAAPEVTESVTAERVPQTITFGALSDQTFGDPPFNVSASATSSLAVTFSSLTPTVCTTSGTNGSTVTMIAAGTCTIEADQPGDSDYLPAPSVTQSFKVNKAVTTTTLSSSGAAVVGGPVMFTVSVADASTGSTGTPSGTVTISDGNYAIGLITLSSGGGSFTTTLLSSTGSPHNINAHYNGDPNFQTSDATAVSQVINTRGTSTTLAFNPTQGTFETPDTITATVAEAAGLPSPSGTPDSFTGSGNLGTARKGATATQLLSGLILVVGGQDTNANIIGSAELYNPVTGTSVASGGTLGTARYDAAAALLADGRVLIAGGTGSGGVVLNSAEIYNPTTDSFTSTGLLQTARTGATATLLTSGKVVVIGGSGDGMTPLSSNTVETFDPTGNSGVGTFGYPSTGTGLAANRFGHVAAMLASGKILIAGGNDGSAALKSAEIYDPAANTSTALTATLSVAREFAGAAEMPNNYTLIAGGDSNGSTPLGTADLYDPQAQAFYASSATLGTARTQLAAVQLNDGRVLTVGGAGPVPPSTNAVLASVEAYTPAFTPQGAVALSSTGSGDTFTGTCQLQPAMPATNPAQSTCTETIDPGSAGTDSVTGNYPADVVHSASSSGATSFTVNPATTSTTVSSSANPSIFGQSVTFTAVVSNTSTGSTGTPTGSVSFAIDGATPVAGTSASCPSGSPTYSLCATYSTASLTVSGSPHSVTAKYVNADGNFSGSDNSASPLMQTVKPAPTSTTVSSSANPSIFGQSVTFTATVANEAGAANSTATPTGSVQFYVDGTAFGSAVVISGSGATATGTSGATATLTVSSSPHTIKATYTNSDGNFSGSYGSLAGGQTVNPAPTSTTVTSSVNPSTFGQSVTFTATVANTAGAAISTATPTGAIALTIDGSPVTPTVSNVGNTLTAVYSTTALTVNGSPHKVKATYTNSDGNFSGSYGSVSQTVQPAPTSTAVTSSQNPSTYGLSVAFTATVANISGATISTATPIGSVQFYIDGSPFGSPVMLAGLGSFAAATSSATATLTVNGSPHSVTATYINADGNFSGSGGTLSGGQIVQPAMTSTSVSSSLNPSTYGDSVTFTAVVSNASGTGATPTGSVQFTIDSGTPVGGTAISCPMGVPANSLCASFSTSSLTVSGSPHSVAATYVNADGNFSGSSGTLSGGQAVNQANSATTLAVSPVSTILGDAVTLTATVSDSSSGSTGTPTGLAVFFDGTTPIGTGNLSGAATDTATFTTSLLAVGSHSITAAYQGDANFKPSATSTATTETVNLRSSSVAVALNAATVVVGQLSAATVTVTDNGMTNPPGMPDTWVATTGAPGTGTTGGTATLFANGMVLVAGGANSSGTAVANAYIYNATTRSFTPTGNLNTARTGATATLLPNGKILIAGGSSDGTAAKALNTAELFDPTGNSGAGTFTVAGSGSSNVMTAARLNATATLLANGQVLIAGGQNSGALSSAELYNPATDTFAATGGLTTPRCGAAATLLSNGNVLIVGGTSSSGTLASAELYSSGSFTSAGNMTVTRTGATATLLLSGKVLVAGGSSDGATPLNTAELYDPTYGTFSLSNATLNTVRFNGTATLLPNGMVLLVGGTTSQATELYDPDSDKFDATGSLVNADQASLTATLLNKGHVLVTGLTSGGSADAELYTPSFNPLGTVALSSSEATDSFGAACVLMPSSATASTCASSVTPSNVATSPHMITGTYPADAVHSGNTNTTSLTVNKADTTTSVTSSLNPSIYGQAVTFTAAVSVNPQGAGTPTGTVQFLIDGTSYSSPVPVGACNPSAANAVCASFSIFTLTVPSHIITASYSGDSNFNGTGTGNSTATGVTQTVNKAATATAVASSLSPSVYGQPVTFTATVADATPNSTATPTGTVQFSIDGMPYGSPVSVGACSPNVANAVCASFSTHTLTPPSHTISASYSGDGNFTTSNGSTTQTVAKADTVTTIASSLNPSVYGRSVTFAATVADATTSSAGTPTGTVQFYVDGTAYGSPVSATACSPIMANAVCASFSTQSLTVPSHAITAAYSGDTNFNATGIGKSTAIGVTQTVQPAPLTITASSGSMTYGGSPFVVMPIFSGLVNGDTPATFGVSPNSPPTCLPILTSTTPAGPYISTCTNAADSNYMIGYAPGSVIVSQATTTTTVMSTPNPSIFLQPVTFTATVADSSKGSTGMPTGTVSFYDAASNATCGNFGSSTLIGGIAQPLINGSASVSTAGLSGSVGGQQHTILACYSGDNNFQSSNNTTTQTVNAAPVVTVSPTSISFTGQNVNTTSSPATVIVTNIGDTTLNFASGSPAIAGNNPNEFSTYTIGSPTPPYCGSTLAAGSSCTINVTFTPKDTGEASSILQITDNNDNVTGSLQNVTLTGGGLSTITAGGSLYSYAVFATQNACGSITVSGNSTVDSFNSSATGGYSSSHVLSGGNVGTNGNVTLSGNAIIYGSAAVDYATTGNCTKSSLTGVTMSGKAKLTGGQIALNGPVTYPAPPAPNPAPPTTAQNVSHSCPSGMTGCTNNGNNTVTLTPGSYGNVQFTGGTTADLSTGTYNFNSLALSGNSILYVKSVSGPVIVNIAGAGLSGANPALDLSGGSIVNPTAIPANLEFLYGGAHGVNLSGGSQAYATIYAPAAPVNMSGGTDFFGGIIGLTVTDTGGTAIHGDTNLFNIAGGYYVWLAAVVNNIQSKGSPLTGKAGQVKLYLTNSTISFTANGTPHMVQVPNAVVTLNSASATAPKTSYDLTNNRWATAIPPSDLTGNTFVTGIAIPVPASGFPAGIQNVNWSAAFSTDTPNITFQWGWTAGVYNSSFGGGTCPAGAACPVSTYASSSNSNLLGVNPEDGSADTNGTDPAGTPETYKQDEVIGFFSAPAGVAAAPAEVSAAPSNYAFASQGKGTPSSTTLVTVLTNNDGVVHNFVTPTGASGPIYVLGTNGTDFVLQAGGSNNCVGMTSLIAGGSCNVYIVFTPSTQSAESGKIVINDDANNSPQTVYLSGTGQ